MRVCVCSAQESVDERTNGVLCEQRVCAVRRQAAEARGAWRSTIAPSQPRRLAPHFAQRFRSVSFRSVRRWLTMHCSLLGVGELLKTCVFVDSLGIAGCASLNDSGSSLSFVDRSSFDWVCSTSIRSHVHASADVDAATQSHVIGVVAFVAHRALAARRSGCNTSPSFGKGSGFTLPVLTVSWTVSLVCAFGSVAQRIVECQRAHCCH